MSLIDEMIATAKWELKTCKKNIQYIENAVKKFSDEGTIAMLRESKANSEKRAEEAKKVLAALKAIKE